MRRVITGEQVAQIYSPDPFAAPFRAPVYQTPAGTSSSPGSPGSCTGWPASPAATR